MVVVFGQRGHKIAAQTLGGGIAGQDAVSFRRTGHQTASGVSCPQFLVCPIQQGADFDFRIRYSGLSLISGVCPQHLGTAHPQPQQASSGSQPQSLIISGRQRTYMYMIRDLRITPADVR